MSLILDALNRSRQDAEQVPGLATPHFVEGPAARPGWRQVLPWVGLVLALLVIAWLVFDRSGGDSAPAAGPKGKAEKLEITPEREQSADELSVGPGANTGVGRAAAPAPVSTGERLRQERASRAAARPPPRPEQSEGGAGPQGPRAALSPQAQDVAAAAATPAPDTQGSNTADSEAVARLYQRSGQLPEPAPMAAAKPAPAVPAPEENAARSRPAGSEEQPLDIGEILSKAEQELEDSRLQEHPAPFLADLSQQAKDAIPTLMYRRHDYSEVAGQSSVVINGTSVRVGGNVAGVRVDEILPGSVVLSHQGRQFRLRALNSWVNL